jgi:uncharacterized membrane protein YkoI
MPSAVRKTLITVAALGAIAAGSSALAGAAGNRSNSTIAASEQQSSNETALTGDTAAKVKTAALAKVSGGTIVRVETDGQHGSPYEAHVRKADGTEVEVLVNKDFEVTAVREGGPRGGPGGPRGGPGGRSDEKELTGETASKVKAAAQAKVSGGTVLRVETDADHGSPYEAHVRKSDGTEVEVLVNKDFAVTAVNTMHRP